MKIQDKIRDKIFRKLWDVGDSAYMLSPCLTNILARYNGGMIDDDLLDIVATGSYPVEEGHSWLADGVAYGEFESPVTLPDDFTVSFKMAYRNAGVSQLLLGNSTLGGGLINIVTDLLNIHIDSIKYTFSNLTLINGTTYDLSIIRVGINVSLYSSGQLVQTVPATTDTTGYNQVGSRDGGTSNLDCNLYDVHIEDSTGVIFSNFLAQDSTDMKMLSEVGPDVQFVNGTYPIVEKSVAYGHEWDNYSVVADDSKIPQDPTNIGKDVLGNALTNPGTPQKNMEVTGYTGAWDGGTTGLLNTIVSPSGDFKITSRFSISNLTSASAFIGGEDIPGGIIRVNSSGTLGVWLGGGPITFDNVVVTLGLLSLITIVVDGVDVTATLVDANGTQSETKVSDGVRSLAYTEIGSRSLGAGDQFFGTLKFLKVEQNGIITNHWICESSPTSLQDTIYDIVGGNHATLTGATLPFFTTEMEGSKLLKDGFDEAGGSDGLIPAGTDGLSATGSVLTNQAGQIEGSPVYLNAPLSSSFFEADEGNLVWYDSGGVPKDVTPDDLVAWTKNYSDQYFFDDYKNLLIYSEDISGACLEKTEDYVGK